MDNMPILFPLTQPPPPDSATAPRLVTSRPNINGTLTPNDKHLLSDHCQTGFVGSKTKNSRTKTQDSGSDVISVRCERMLT